MADDDILGNVERLKETIPELTEQIHGVADAKDRLTDSTSRVSERLNVLSIETSNATKKLSDLFDSDFSSSKILDSYKGLIDANNQLTEQIKLTDIVGNEMATNFGTALFTLLAPGITKGTEAFGKMGSEGAAAGLQISDSFKGLDPVFNASGKIGDFFKGPLSQLAKTADQARNTELALYNYAAAAGDLSDVLKDGLSVQDMLSDGAAAYSLRIQEIGDNTGRVSSEISSYYANLAKIPGAMRDAGVQIDSFGNRMDGLAASIKIADAFGMSHEEVVNHLSLAYRNFDTSVQGGLEQVAQFASSAQNLKMPLEMMRGYIKEVTSGMASMGDGTQAAINLADTLGQRLRDTGTSVQGTTDILGKITDAAKGMDMGQAAFISQASGGPGGLAGAFEIEALRQEGKLDEIARMAMQSIERVTGSVTTLQDVREDPSKAGQLMLQTQMLKQFGLAGDNQQAFRVLEAMKGGDLSAIGEGAKTPQDVLRESIERGTEIQSTGFNKLVIAANKIEAAIRGMSHSNLEALRKVDESEIGGLQPDLRTTGPIAGVDFNVDAGEWGRETRETFVDTMSSVKDMFAEMKDYFTKQNDMFSNMMKNEDQFNNLPITTPAEAMRIMDSDSDGLKTREAVRDSGAIKELTGTLDVNINIRDELDKIIEKRVKIDIKEAFSQETKQSFSGVGR